MSNFSNNWKIARHYFQMSSKKGTLDVKKYIYILVGVMILFQVLAIMYPTASASGTTLNESGFPLGELFVAGGVIWIILSAGVLLFLVGKLMAKSGGK